MNALEQEPDVEERPAGNQDAWVEAIIAVARHYRLDCSEENLRLAARWNIASGADACRTLVARQAGLGLRFTSLDAGSLSAWRLPMVVEMTDGQVGVLESLDAEGTVGLRLVGDQGLPTSLPRAEFLAGVRRAAILRPLGGRRDSRVDGYIEAYRKHWLWRIVLRDLRPYGHVMLASLLINALGLAGVIFSMQVYDRVIPAESMPTLYVLFSGVLLAALFAFVMRQTRNHVTDILGKRADMRVSDRVFGHAIRLRNSARPRSTGSFISQLRELEQVRELITSSTVGAVADLPFFLLFLLVFWLIAPALAWIPLAAVVLMLLPGLLAQRALGQRAQASMRESSLRNALLVETVQGLEDIKAMQAEDRIQQQWNHYNAETAHSGMAMKRLVHGLNNWSQTIQGTVFAVVVLFGAPLVMAGDMTTGSLVAASILSSRMLAPLGQLTQVLNRWQQARVAIRSLDNIMQLPLDRPEAGSGVQRPVLRGDYLFKDASFRYSPDAPALALQVAKLEIRAGERIAVLGRNGAGKSSLLQALAGGIDLVDGSLRLDGIAMPHLDPADVRRDVGLLTQNARLFHGSLRDNLTLGAPLASDEAIVEALGMSGAADFLARLPQGLEYPVMEGGVGLSGGQRQSLLLARLLLRQPNILLLDEPTASLDDNTEQQFLDRLGDWIGGRTLVVATHRLAVLRLVERVIVVESGRILLDAPKEQAIARLSRTTPLAERSKA
ncbi:type I secretion system permease/ATPase [Pseudomonas sp. ABC1]|uniref:type I secretion system permease/ATPase n=1 Tax=Pseudomonas sp. ABC1 TaxID=2748080 RepID=UPI0015C2EBA0|nr:type I secretion system permease/ATPase [Pseudomonas sp. ABC1]QLF93149.1 type I secretion system permease/ATPase [Pseudomonas sp. ABC1]